VRPAFALLWLLAVGNVSAAQSFDEVHMAWRPSEAFLLDRNGALLQQIRIDRTARRLSWMRLDEISPALIRAVIAAEDRRFNSHHGVDWRALAAAAWNRLRGGPPRGASTLSMQVAALLDPGLAPHSGRRSLYQKAAQIRAALDLEETWSKGQIIEAYLNLVSFRGELQGIAAAAGGLFDKHPSGLDEAESLLLAAALPSPRSEPDKLARRACAIARAAAFSVDCAALARRASRLPIAPGIPPTANLAPHVASQLLHQPAESVTTTLDAAIQGLALETLEQQLKGLASRNVRDGAALVADNGTGEILAYVGSAGPASRAPLVDGVRARRQAGSTLKPFLYGLALERRYLTAASLLSDTPVNLETTNGLYIPQNYDRDFKGTVSVRTALAGSLNVPAVRTLALVGVERFRQRLHATGYSGIARDGDYYGFSLALGSAEVSLWEQVNAYRALANGGLYRPLRLRPGSSGDKPPRRVLDENAAFLVSDILADRTGRAITFGLDNPLTTRFWSAVKTGTSKDMRDNWCIGFSQRYTVGVWVGNFEGDAMHDVSGITGAAPVWLSIMDALHAEDGVNSRPPDAPAGLDQRGIRFAPAVEPPRSEWFLAGTATDTMTMIDPQHKPPRISSPPNGVVVALDPDMPPANQAMLFIANPPQQDLSFLLDGRSLASASQHYRWQPQPGRHRLSLVGSEGKTYDTVGFTVRTVRLSARVTEPKS
jgi:penicillin-binding protein 1C